MADSIGIGIAIALIGIGVIGMILSGLRAVINGKSDFKRIVIMLLPLLIFIITYFSMGDANRAGMATLSIMVILMVLSILISGTRGTLRF